MSVRCEACLTTIFFAPIFKYHVDGHKFAGWEADIINNTYARSVDDKHIAVWHSGFLCLVWPGGLHHHTPQVNAVLNQAAPKNNP